jgi:hypothetical protein
MKRAIILIVFLVMLMLLPCVEANNDSLKVLVFVPQDQYETDEEVTMSVHIFDKAEYVNPTSIEGKMTSYKFEDELTESEKSIALVEEQRGIWTGTTILTEEDINSDALFFKATAQEQNNEDSGTSYLFFDDPFSYYDISVRAENIEDLVDPQPGDTIKFKISVKNSDEFVDPDELIVKIIQTDSSYELYETEDEEPEFEILSTTWVSTGNYTTEYIIPDLKESRCFNILVETEKGETFSIMPFDSQFFLDFYQVWFHELKSTSSSSNFEIYISDKLGKVVEGAVVNLKYSYTQYDDSDWTEEDWTEPEEQTISAGQKTTDNEGKVLYDVTFPNDVDSVDGMGEVKFDGYTQHFYGPIYLGDTYYEDEYYEEEEEDLMPPIPPDENEPYGYGFEVIPDEFDEEYQFGDYIVRHYTAYYTENANPIGIDRPQDADLYVNGEIYYYIFSEEEILTYGKTETNDNGKFELAFNLPSVDESEQNPYGFNSYEISFEAPTHEADITEQDSTNDGMIYDEAWDYIYVYNDEMYMDDESYFEDMFTNDANIEIEHLYVGGVSEFEMVSDNIGENFRAYSSWVPFAFSMDMAMSPPDDLMNWYPWTNDGLAIKLLSLNGTKYEGTICVPEFMPINTDYTILVQIYDLDSVNNMDFYISPEVSFTTVTPEAAPGSLAEKRDNSSPEPASGFRLDFWVFAIFIIIIIIIIVIAVARRHRRNKNIVSKQVQSSQVQPQQRPQITYQHPSQISKKFECPQCKSQFVINGYHGQSVPIKCPNCNVQGQVRI